MLGKAHILQKMNAEPIELQVKVILRPVGLPFEVEITGIPRAEH